MDERNEGQWRVIRKVLAVTQAADIPMWLFGGWGLDGTPVPAMSVSGMLAMKEQYPHLRNGGPWRQKDIGDIEILRGLVIEPSAGLTPGPSPAEDGRKSLSQNERESRS
jgi:hypothetical protein